MIGFAQRTPAPPEPAGAPTPGIARPFANSSAPPPFNVREAVLAVVASVREASAAATASDNAARPPTRAGRAQQAAALRAQAPSGSGANADALPASPTRKKAAAAAASIPPTPNARSGTGGGGASSGGAAPGTAAPGAAEALKAPQPAWHPQLAPLAYADVAQLVATAGSLYDVLLSHR